MSRQLQLSFRWKLFLRFVFVSYHVSKKFIEKDAKLQKKHYHLSHPMITSNYADGFYTFFCCVLGPACDMHVFLVFTVQIVTYDFFLEIKNYNISSFLDDLRMAANGYQKFSLAHMLIAKNSGSTICPNVL